MPSFNFLAKASHYCYPPGVNAANLTMNDIRSANAKIAHLRQGRIDNGLLKATRDDPGYQPQMPYTKKPLCKYFAWDTKKLAESLLARGIKSRQQMKFMDKEDMVSALKNADKQPRFDRFTELPAECRNEIYRLALEDTKPRVRPAPPAISQVSRQLRSETLPLFFHMTTLTVVVTAEPAKPIALSHYFGDHKTEIAPRTRKYFNYARKAGWTKHMRNFQWRIMGASYSAKGRLEKPWNECYTVRFSTNMKNVETFARDRRSQARLDLIQAGMKKIADTENTKLTDADFKNMVAFFLATF